MTTSDDIHRAVSANVATLKRFAESVGRYDPHLHLHCKIYKLRAEVHNDLFVGFTALANANGNACTKIIQVEGMSLSGFPLPSAEVVFASTLSLDELRSAWTMEVDLHVMIQTVAHIQDYTGNRNFDL